MKKINVLFIESGSGYGGSSKCLYLLLKNLDKKIFNPSVLFYRLGPNIANLRREYFQVNKYSLFLLPLFLLKTDIVYINNEIYSHFINIILAKIFLKKCICHIRGIRPLTKREKSVAGWVDKFIAVSAKCRDNFIKEGIPADKIGVIYDGIDQDGVLVEPSRYPKVKIGVVGRINHGKGQYVFIEAAKKVLSQKSGIEFIIIGDDVQHGKPTLCQLKNLVLQANLEKDIIFVGWKSDLSSIYATLDIVVCPSLLQEALGNVVIEAMTFAKPIVASSIGAYPEMIADGKNGLLFEAGNANNLAEKIEQLLNDSALRQRLSQEARRTAEENFDIKKNVAQIERVIEDVDRQRNG